jgi:DNA modification methylase
MNKILITDVLTGLRTLPDGAAQTCVTSPPYYGLRNYGLRNYGVEPTYWPSVTYTPMAGLPPVTIPAQTCCLGLESDPLAFIGHLVLVFREMHRVLRKDGTLWVNIGDSYAGSWGNYSGQNRGNGSQREITTGSKVEQKAYDGKEDWRPPTSLPISGTKNKDLLGIPWKLAFALQADGWYLRQDVIWHKPNPMPESVTDRCTKAHEYVFLLTKSQKYYFDAAGIKVPAKDPADDARRIAQQQNGNKSVPTDKVAGLRVRASDTFRREDTIPDGLANRRSVWSIATQPYSGAHFAVFPPELPRLCILAGSKPADVVIDPFMGSGTTAAVAVEIGRNYIGIDQDPRNAAQQRQRLNEAGTMFCSPAPSWDTIPVPPVSTGPDESPVKTGGTHKQPVQPVLTGTNESPVETGDTL